MVSSFSPKNLSFINSHLSLLAQRLSLLIAHVSFTRPNYQQNLTYDWVLGPGVCPRIWPREGGQAVGARPGRAHGTGRQVLLNMLRYSLVCMFIINLTKFSFQTSVLGKIYLEKCLSCPLFMLEMIIATDVYLEVEGKDGAVVTRSPWRGWGCWGL